MPRPLLMPGCCCGHWTLARTNFFAACLVPMGFVLFLNSPNSGHLWQGPKRTHLSSFWILLNEAWAGGGGTGRGRRIPAAEARATLAAWPCSSVSCTCVLLAPRSAPTSGPRSCPPRGQAVACRGSGSFTRGCLEGQGPGSRGRDRVYPGVQPTRGGSVTSPASSSLTRPFS